MLGNSSVHLSCTALYGYRKDSEVKHKWLVDEEAVAVVKRISPLCIEGNSTNEITNILREDGVKRSSRDIYGDICVVN